MAFDLLNKVEFCYRYRVEFDKIRKVKWFPNSSGTHVHTLVRYIAQRARIEIGYSRNSSTCDIVRHLEILYTECVQLARS